MTDAEIKQARDAKQERLVRFFKALQIRENWTKEQRAAELKALADQANAMLAAGRVTVFPSARAMLEGVGKYTRGEMQELFSNELLGKRRLHPIDISIEFSGFAVGVHVHELAGESRTSSF